MRLGACNACAWRAHTRSMVRAMLRFISAARRSGMVCALRARERAGAGRRACTQGRASAQASAGAGRRARASEKLCQHQLTVVRDQCQHSAQSGSSSTQSHQQAAPVHVTTIKVIRRSPAPSVQQKQCQHFHIWVGQVSARAKKPGGLLGRPGKDQHGAGRVKLVRSACSRPSRYRATCLQRAS